MNPFDDSSNEMYNDDLSSSDAEGLVCGEINSPAHAELIGMMSEVRNLASGTPTPKPGAALSEFVGVGLSTNNIPVETLDAGIDLRLTPSKAAPVTTRRSSVFAQIAAFAGTIGGKVVVSGAVAAASITGAHVTGVVDVPGMPDAAVEIETVDTELVDGQVEVADVPAPEALSFADDKSEANNVAAEEDTDGKVESKEPEAEKDPAIEADLVDELEKKAADEATEAKDVEARAAEEAKKVEIEKAELEAQEAEELAKKEAEEKAELEAKKKAAEEEAANKASDPDLENKLTALETQLNRDKDAVRSEAAKDIEYYETKHKNKEALLAAELVKIDEQFSGYVADIDAQIEAAKDEGELAELNEYREKKLGWWDDARADKEAAFAPYLADIAKELESIELARDAKVELLIAEFLKAVEQAKK